MGLFDSSDSNSKNSVILPTAEKANSINSDRSKYGTFAEIGAGQEVVRWFFLVGGASGTVAKSMSAYDMTVSDAIYGKTDRYVSRKRLIQMLDHEYSLNVERLGPKYQATRSLFAFADTVATKSRRGSLKSLAGVGGHGWMGIRFQDAPGSEPSQIILHLNMLDIEASAQQDALGIVGVNLIHGAYNCQSPVDLMASLLDNLTRARIEVDMIEFSGKRYEGFDNRLTAMWLLSLDLSDAVMIGPSGAVLHPSDMLFRRPVLVERGRFDPVTNTHLDILECGKRAFAQFISTSESLPVVLFEMSTHNLILENELNKDDFLARVDMINSLGQTVLVTDFPEYYRLAAYLRRYTEEPCGMALSVSHLRELFDEKYYQDLDGGILEGLGLLFKTNFKFFIYPIRESAEILTATTFSPPEPLGDIYQYLRRRGCILDITDYDPDCLDIFAEDVVRLKMEGNESWRAMVPAPVADLLEKRPHQKVS